MIFRRNGRSKLDRFGPSTAGRLGQRRGSFTPHDGHEGKRSARQKRADAVEKVVELIVES
jgi:hypothetical protein